MDENEKNNMKEIEYYSQIVSAWVTTKLEKDKSILTISAAGLGLLVTLISTLGINNFTEMILYICTIFFFMIAIVTMILIFERNSHRLENQVNGNDAQDYILSILDYLGVISFSIAIFFTFIIGISVSLHSLPRNKELKALKKMEIVSEKKVVGADQKTNNKLEYKRNNFDKKKEKQEK